MLLNISVQAEFDGSNMSIIFKWDQNRNKEFEGYTLSWAIGICLYSIGGTLNFDMAINLTSFVEEVFSIVIIQHSSPNLTIL